MGLVADSLDMLADSFVYGLSLWAVGSTVLRKKKVARRSGYFQLSLALLDYRSNQTIYWLRSYGRLITE